MKIQLSLLLTFSLLLFSCPPQENNKPNSTDGEPITTVSPKETTPKPIPPFEVETPRGHTLLSQTSGDLNKDGVDEKIIVFNNGQVGDFGEERTILIFKADNGAWKMWERATGAILPSENGGMMGDPFQSIKVENGALVINHFGGSRSKWEYTHRFRYQNEKWELIGTTSIVYAPCEEQQTFDYNLTSGNVIYKDVKLTCTNGENEKVKEVRKNVNFKDKKSQLPTLNGFDPSSVYAINSKTGNCYPEGPCYSYTKKIGENEKKSPNVRMESMNDLNGLYALGGHDESWIVDVYPKDIDWDKDIVTYEVNYYALDGMIPDLETFRKFKRDYKHQTLKKFKVDFPNWTFDSDLGKGKIGVDEAENITLTFLDIKSHIDDQLLVTHLGEYYSIDH